MSGRPRTSALRKPVAGLSAPPPLKALLLDDVAFDRRRLIRACERAGVNAEFTEVATLAALQAALEATVFDLVFIDYRLPDGNGLAALGQVMADPRHADCATIMVAGEADASVAVEALKSGCSDYIGKADFGPAALNMAVTNAVSRAAKRRQISTLLGLNGVLCAALDRLAGEAGTEMRADLETLIAAAGRGAAPVSARRLRGFLDEIAAYGTPD